MAPLFVMWTRMVSSVWGAAGGPGTDRGSIGRVSGYLGLAAPRSFVRRVHCANSIRVADMFKSLGCTVDLPTPAEREKMGLKLADANKFRKATLKAPLKFPKTKRRGPAKR